MNTKDFNEMSVQWEKANLKVVADKHLPSGIRVHLVEEDISPRIIQNALVVGIDKWKAAESFDELMEVG